MNNGDLPAAPVPESVYRFWADSKDPSKGEIDCAGLTKREAMATLIAANLCSLTGDDALVSRNAISKEAVLQTDDLLAELERTATIYTHTEENK